MRSSIQQSEFCISYFKWNSTVNNYKLEFRKRKIKLVLKKSFVYKKCEKSYCHIVFLKLLKLLNKHIHLQTGSSPVHLPPS